MEKKITAKELAQLVGGELNGNESINVVGVESLKNAKSENVSFLSNKKYASQVAESGAGIILVSKGTKITCRDDQALVLCDDPDAAFTKVVSFFAPPAIEFKPGVHPSAVVSDTAVIGENVHIGANAVIEEGASIGDNSVITAGTVIGHFSKVGNNCLIYQNVSVRERCIIGNYVIIHPGTVIGSDGYGYAPTPQGAVKIPQLGIVQIDDHVEIGSNCSIDRARFGKTWIKAGAKLDNLIQIAHNVEVGEGAMLIGQSGIAGSAVIGRGVVIGAQAGINGHITLGDGAKIAATSGVAKSVPPGEIAAGTPAEKQKDLMERLVMPRKVKKLAKKLFELEAEMKRMLSK